MASFALTMTRGDTRRWTFKFTRGGAPEPLTGATIWFTAKAKATDSYAAAKIKKSSGALGGITITNAAGGLAELMLSPSDTTSLQNVLQKLVCDVQLLTASGDVESPREGTLTITPEITDTVTP